MSARLEALSERAENEPRAVLAGAGSAQRGYDLATRLARNGSGVDEGHADWGVQALEREDALIKARFMRVRDAVLNQPEIARQAHAYEEMLYRRMIQIEPLTESLVARSVELQRLLQSALPRPPR